MRERHLRQFPRAKEQADRVVARATEDEDVKETVFEIRDDVAE